ncbi:MAG: hypothetical protein KIS94_11785 [Chitinophagales bacterium]|nr:hypothetical protein [Chitinophagales bacterium]
MYLFIENIKDAIRDDIGLFNRYLNFIGMDGMTDRCQFTEVSGNANPTTPAPLLVQR